MDDIRIIELFRQRSEDALAECERKFGAYCRTIAKNILGSDADADECVNDLWLRAWKAIPPATPSRLKSFLGKITRNLALDRFSASRAQKRGGAKIDAALEELADIPTPAPKTDEGEITRIINRFLRSEPAENADIFLKRYWHFQSLKEIASEYGYSESKTASLVFRMRGRLRKELEREGLL